MAKLSAETVAFLEDVRRAAFDCADMYSIDEGLPADAAPEVAEAYWELFLGTVRDRVGLMCTHLGATPEWVTAVQNIAIKAVGERLDQLAEMPEGGRA